MEKLIITAAICGAEVTKDHNPAVPYTVEEIAREAYSAYSAGASVIHLHVREDDGTPTQRKERYDECIKAIREKCPDVIIQPSTGGSVGMTSEERLEPVYLKPGKKMIDLGVKPEVEVFDKSMIDMAVRLSKKGFIKEPVHFSFVMGVNGGISGELRDFIFLKESIPCGSTYSVAGIGKFEFTLAAASIISGGHVRVGFEDNIYISKGVLAKSNGELVEKVVRIAKEFGREIANPTEARKILGLN